ncbi:hypothetical protein HK098_000855 [Nowakowskiella sp. JEL0407]|nr:hypothetical protein HK098_000855 [Nowakowskiella sp. JEL0407]
MDPLQAQQPSETIDVVEVFHDYQPPVGAGETLLGLERGEIILVHAKDSTGWWHGTVQSTNQQGWFPSNYVKPTTRAVNRQRSGSNAGKKLDESLAELGQFIEKPQVTQEPEGADVELPPYWGVQLDANGKTYYYNIETNQTTYDLQEVLATQQEHMTLGRSLNRSLGRTKEASEPLNNSNSSLSEKKEALAKSEHSEPISTPKSAPIEVSQSPRSENFSEKGSNGTIKSVSSWDNNVTQIQSAINELTKSSVTADNSSKYIQRTTKIVRNVCVLFACCDALTRDSPTIKKYKALRTHHQNVTNALSKMVVSSKIADGFWPPPDSVQKMRNQANQVLSSVNFFVTAAKEFNIDFKDFGENDSTEAFDENHNELTDSEITARMDGYSEAIVGHVSKLSTIVGSDQGLSKALIEEARLTVIEVGHLMSLVEDIKVFSFKGPNDLSAFSDSSIKNFRQKKDQVYSAINRLITSARACLDEFAPPDALETLQSTATSVQDTVQELLISSKVLIDQNDYSEKLNLLSESEYYSSVSGVPGAATIAKLELLQKRSASLVIDQTPATPKTNSIDDLSNDANFFPKTARSMSIGSNGLHHSNVGSPPVSGMSVLASSPQSQHMTPYGSQHMFQNANDFDQPPPRRQSAQFSVQQQQLLAQQIQQQHNGTQYHPVQHQSYSSVSQPKTPTSSAFSYNERQQLYSSSPPQPPPSLPPPPAPQQVRTARTPVLQSPVSVGAFSTSPNQSYSSVTPQLQLQMQQMQIQQQMMSRQGSTVSGTPTSEYSSRDRFFQEELMRGPMSGGQVQGMNTPNKEAWYLAYEYHRDEISYNPEGYVNGGTIRALVERLTLHDQPSDPAYLEVFLMMFHCFTSSQDFFSFLLNRFFLVMPSGITPEEVKQWQEKKQKPIRLRVFRVLVAWLDSYWIEAYDDPVLEQLQKFAIGPFSDAMPMYASTLIDCVNRKINTVNNPDIRVREINMQQEDKLKQLVQRHRQLQAQSQVQLLGPQQLFTDGRSKGTGNLSFFECFPPPILPKSLKRVSLIDLDPTEIARQLTIMEMKRYCAIGVVELLGQEWTKTPSLAPNVKAMNHMQAKRCLALNNFNTLISIQSALGSSAIVRLKKTWENLGNKLRQTYENIRESIGDSRNYIDYKNHIRTADLPCLPCLSFSLVDLSYTEDGTSSIRNGRLVNFEKYGKLSLIIKEIQRFQVPYPLSDVPGLQKWLNDVIENSCKRGMQELFRMSLELEKEEHKQAEATQRDMDSKFKMLERAGLL